MSNFWDEQETIGSVDKNKNEKIIISVCKRNNKKYIDMRIYSKSKEDSSQYIPTSKGLNVECTKLKELKECLDLIKDI